MTSRKAPGAKASAPTKKPAGKSGITFRLDDDVFRKGVEAQRAHIRDGADMLESGRELDQPYRRFLAAVLRQAADQLPREQPKSKGHQPEIEPGGLALEYALMRTVQGMSKTAAIDKLATEAGVSIEAIKNALGKHGDEAMRMAEGATKIRKKS